MAAASGLACGCAFVDFEHRGVAGGLGAANDVGRHDDQQR